MRSYRFHFYSDEGDEPAHIHVDVGDGECKFWLDPVTLARSINVSAAEVRKSNVLFSSIEPY